MTNPVHQIMQTFSVLTPDMNIEPVEVTPTLYQDLEKQYESFSRHALIACHEFNEPWPTWESHPAGDECVILLSGTVTLTLQVGDKHESHDLNVPGEYVIVPRGVWHTASAASDARMLFVTPGEGTQNLEIPPKG